jgi:fatty-acyl-CoA synthase
MSNVPGAPAEAARRAEGWVRPESCIDKSSLRPDPNLQPVYVSRLVARLDQAGSSIVLKYRDETITGHAFLASIFRFARALSNIGVGPDSLVALLAPNHPDALAIRYASNMIGAAATYLSVPSSAEARATLLRQIAPSLLVVFPETASLVPDRPGVRIAAVGGRIAGGSVQLDVLAAGQPGEPVPCRVRPNGLAVIISSGGSTGVPKGSWRSLSAYSAMVDVPTAASRRQLVNGRLAYLSQVLVDITLLGGGLVVLRDGFDEEDTLATIERDRITDLFLVEPQLFALMDHPDVARRDLSSLRTLTHIGASAPPTLRRRARERLGPILVHTYGASEMGIVSSLGPGDHDLAHPETYTSAGRIHPGVEVRFRRPDGTLANAGEVGGIEVRSPAMAGGYYNRPDLEAAAFRDGWYCSGDLGQLDAAGNLHILGRAADIASIGGTMISPTMIEDALCRLPSVRYAVAFLDPATATWIVAVEAWPGSAVDVAGCTHGIGAEYGSEAAALLRIVPVQRVPLTEQGKPDREAIQTAVETATRGTAETGGSANVAETDPPDPSRMRH